MFDFSIAQNQKKRPSKRLLASAAVSCLFHLLILIILVQNPWLLHGGKYFRFRGLLVSPDASEFTFETEDDNFRTVAVLRPMAVPSAETLKKYTYDWEQPRNTENTPPVRVRWGDEQQDEPVEEIQQYSLTGPKPEDPPGGNEDAFELSGVLDKTVPEPEGSPDSNLPDSTGILLEPAAQMDPPEATPEPAAEDELAANMAPTRIPEAIPPPGIKSTPDGITIFDDERQALKRRGSGLFGTEGFPLGEYASRIKRQVTSNWMIPSNLRNSDEFTTIVFFIDRDGQHFDIQIVESSGNSSLDLTAMNAILNSNPFPPLPPGFPGDHVGVKYIFIPEFQ